MAAPARKISPAVIGLQGLDVLHTMRVKVASSLLMADYIQADVQEWRNQPVDVLVAFVDGNADEVLRKAKQKGLPVLAVTREMLSDLNIPGVLYGASVREIFQQLRHLLIEGDKSGEKFRPRTLFRSLDDADGQSCLLYNGLVKVMVNAARDKVTVIRDLPYENCLKAASEQGWTLAVLAAKEAEQEALADAARQHAFEDFCWRAAALSSDPLVPLTATGTVGLTGWPEVEPGTLPADWLLPMTALLQRAWEPAALATATGVSLQQVHCILGAAARTQLLSEGGPTTHAREGVKVGGFFTRIARRFGLQFGKGNQD